MYTSLSSKMNCLLVTIGVGVFGLMFVSYSLITGGDDWMIEETVTSNDCLPKHNVVFLKTHKTAGSSVQNIFMRYARRHNLLMAVPARGNYLGHPHHFDARMVPALKPGLRYNVLAHHARFRYETMRDLISADAVFVTILRDPVALFESLYAYYSLNATYGMEIDQYATSDRSMLEHHDRRFYKKIGRNQMLFDLGVNRYQFESRSSITWTIRQLERQFDLVMIAERMDESLVLLKDLLCWDTDDVIAFKHNVRTKENRVALKPDVERGVRAWNDADDTLYKHFRSRLRDKIAAFGRHRMVNELFQLRQRTRNWYAYCVEDMSLDGSKVDNQFRAHNKKVFSFRLRSDVNRNDTCNHMAKAELPFTAEMRAAQSRFLLRNMFVEDVTSADDFAAAAAAAALNMFSFS